MNAINLRDAIQPQSGDSVAETVRVNLRAIAEQQKRTGWRMIGFAEPSELRLGHSRRGHVRNDRNCVSSRSLTVIPACATTAMQPTSAANACGTSFWPCGWDGSSCRSCTAWRTDDAHGYHSFGASKIQSGPRLGDGPRPRTSARRRWSGAWKRAIFMSPLAWFWKT